MNHDAEGSALESAVAAPTTAARAAQQIRTSATTPAPPSDGGGWQLPSPVDWHDLHGPDADAMLAMLADFLVWAVPRWGFTTDQFPHACWWQHPDIVEEMTAWWGMWIAYIHNPDAHPADPAAFHERTWSLKQRLAVTYRGRCRHEHAPAARVLTVDTPPTREEAGRSARTALPLSNDPRIDDYRRAHPNSN